MKKRQTEVANLYLAAKLCRRLLFDGASKLVHGDQKWNDDQQYDQDTYSNQDIAKGSIHDYLRDGGSADEWAAFAMITYVIQMERVRSADGLEAMEHQHLGLLCERLAGDSV